MFDFLDGMKRALGKNKPQLKDGLIFAAQFPW
jgi:hypothetical protein